MGDAGDASLEELSVLLKQGNFISIPKVDVLLSGASSEAPSSYKESMWDTISRCDPWGWRDRDTAPTARLASQRAPRACLLSLTQQVPAGWTFPALQADRHPAGAKGRRAEEALRLRDPSRHGGTRARPSAVRSSRAP